MKTVGVIGRIGSGKSYICELFKKHGMPVLNFDKLAKQCYSIQTVADRMIEAFGLEVYEKYSELELKPNLNKIAEIVFNDEQKRKPEHSRRKRWAHGSSLVC